MRIDVTPKSAEVAEQTPTVFSVEIYNTSAIIGAYSVRVLGVDAEWVKVDNQAMSLFPGSSGIARLELTLPKGFPAGRRQLAVQVTSLVDTDEFALTQIDIDVPEERRLEMTVEPTVIYGRRTTTFGVVFRNPGNTVLDIAPTMVDAEEVVQAEFDEPTIRLIPGEQHVSQVRVVGKQPWIGQPAPRALEFSAEGVEEPPAQLATFLQRPVIGRWVITLAGLMAAAAVFGVVISRTFQDVVDQSEVDPALLELALQNEDEAAAGAGGAGVVADAASITGKALVAGSDVGIPGITVELYSADNALVPLATAATDSDGAYTFGGLGGGTFKLRFIGAGFDELWYPNAPTFESAGEVEVEAGADVEGQDIELGAQPGSLSGRVVTDDPTGITAELIVQGSAIGSDVDPSLQLVQASADGTFLFENVPAPAEYILVVRKAGFSTVRRAVSLQAGQVLEDVEIILSVGSGTIAGTVFDGRNEGARLGGVTVVATDGTTTVTTTTVTTQLANGELAVGDFDVRGLPTPGTYTVTLSLDGFQSESLVVALPEGGNQTGTSVTLRSNLGRISGVVQVVDPITDIASPAGNVVITATDGSNVYSTRSSSTQSDSPVGSYDIVELPLPGAYTVTFSGPGLSSETRSVGLTGRTEALAENAQLSPSTGVMRGLIRALSSDDSTPATGGIAITLTDGVTTFETTSSNTSVPPAANALDVDTGAFNYEIGGIPPGTYTLTFARPGSSTLATLVTIDAGTLLRVGDRVVPKQASIAGVVTSEGDPLVGGGVRLYLLDDFPDGDPISVAVTGGDGSYIFTALEAPESYVIAFADTPGGPTLSSLVRTLGPGEQIVLPTVDLPG